MGKRTPSPDQLPLDLRTKFCAGCQQELALWDFGKNKARKDGVQVYCRTCWKAKHPTYYRQDSYRDKKRGYSKTYYQDNRDRLRPIRKAWAEANAEHLSDYNKEWYAENREDYTQKRKAWRKAHPELVRRRTRRYYEANRDKILEERRRWKRAHADKIREQNRRWVEANRDKHNAKGARRRARVRGVQTVDFTPEQLALRWAYYGNKCWICRGPATASDHVKPIAKGGAHMLSNLRPICKSCNSTKHCKWPFNPETVRRCA